VVTIFPKRLYTKWRQPKIPKRSELLLVSWIESSRQRWISRTFGRPRFWDRRFWKLESCLKHISLV